MSPTARRTKSLRVHWTATAKFDGECANGPQTYAGTGILKYSW
ncbi:MAG: hypothetical protein WAM75_05930 [Xanthobacteraceae bacterium]